MIVKFLNNLINIYHFNEIDGYIKSNRKKSGIMENIQGKKIQKSIFDIIKYFNEFGSKNYIISNSLNVNVTVIDDIELNQLYEENKTNIINFKNKGIYIIFD